jgi:lysophospholipase L1-like esterase
MVITGAVLLALTAFVVVEVLIIKYNGTPVPEPHIPRQAQTAGSGSPLSYVVLGDSTAVAQGAAYDQGYAVGSWKYLAERYEVTMVNLGVSGATVQTVYEDQVPKAADLKPDVVLLSAGANDATHFTRRATVQTFLQKIIDDLKRANPDVRIVVTRSPAMDSVSRFPIGARQLLGLRTRQINDAYAPLIARNNLFVAPIAERTRAAFLADTSLTASDKFHPSARGYALWTPVINEALDAALATRR